MNRTVFFDAIRADPFGGSLSQSAVDGIEALFAAWDTYGDGDHNKFAYILGTAFHESDRFKTMEEYASGSAYEGRADLGNTEPGDGKRFKGRGFVQITGRRNYQDWSNRLSIDLIADPARAAEHVIAARICVEGMMLGTFTGKPLGKYIAAGGIVDFYNARRVVNGLDRADLIAKYAKAFQVALQAAAEPASAPEPPPAPPAAPTVEERLAALEAAYEGIMKQLPPAGLADRVAVLEGAARGGAAPWWHGE
jgi:putative chitinase